MTNVTPLNQNDTGVKTCIVLCKSPNGLILEGGYTFVNSTVVRTPSYKRVVLAGANQAARQLAAENPGMMLVSRPHMRAGITINVDEAFFDKWVADHADSNIVRNKMIWKAKSLDEAQGMATDDTERKTGWEARPQVSAEKVEFGRGFNPSVSQIEPRTEDQ